MAEKGSNIELNRGKYPLFLIPQVVKDEIDKHKDKIRSLHIKRTGGHSFRVMTTVVSDGEEKDE
ncbi:hypothetical protein [Methanoplanus endosymbiosus]|uniref:Uncharacterized protein n=1 Tax=Methanoplanus endosymbiosus TaxID=33865 RepID=A0A9E7PST1_9EURY|nr:hypothetical protein [Methanoplanus endosymbiosus]UUX93127.1 hypothetical protein L6E24_03115 [Methanoplanus endosymbiosus]